MFFIYVVILSFASIAMVVYHFKRVKVTKDKNTALYYMFLFIFFWITSRSLYFTDAF